MSDKMRKLNVLEMNRLSVEEFKETKKTPLIVVLDNVRSMHNVGSVFRTCDAFKVKEVWLCGITACPPNAEIHKTALGAELSMDWKYVETAEQAVEMLKEKGYKVAAVEQTENSQTPQSLIVKAQEKYAIILGNEVKGVSQAAINKCDCCLEIPQYGTKHSLNVSVAAGIVIWEVAKKMMG